MTMDEEAYLCGICLNVFRTSQGLDQHIMNCIYMRTYHPWYTTPQEAVPVGPGHGLFAERSGPCQENRKHTSFRTPLSPFPVPNTLSLTTLQTATPTADLPPPRRPSSNFAEPKTRPVARSKIKTKSRKKSENKHPANVSEGVPCRIVIKRMRPLGPLKSVRVTSHSTTRETEQQSPYFDLGTTNSRTEASKSAPSPAEECPFNFNSGNGETTVIKQEHTKEVCLRLEEDTCRMLSTKGEENKANLLEDQPVTVLKEASAAADGATTKESGPMTSTEVPSAVTAVKLEDRPKTIRPENANARENAGASDESKQEGLRQSNVAGVRDTGGGNAGLGTWLTEGQTPKKPYTCDKVLGAVELRRLPRIAGADSFVEEGSRQSSVETAKDKEGERAVLRIIQGQKRKRPHLCNKARGTVTKVKNQDRHRKIRPRNAESTRIFRASQQEIPTESKNFKIKSEEPVPELENGVYDPGAEPRAHALADAHSKGKDLYERRQEESLLQRRTEDVKGTNGGKGSLGLWVAQGQKPKKPFHRSEGTGKSVKHPKRPKSRSLGDVSQRKRLKATMTREGQNFKFEDPVHKLQPEVERSALERIPGSEYVRKTKERVVGNADSTNKDLDESGQEAGARQSVKVTGVPTQRKPYRCNICHKTFAWADHRNRHMLSHQDVKPYACPLCPNKLKFPDGLARHLRNVHSKNVTTTQIKTKYCIR